jgi:arylsulfatase A-like enzyme
MPTVLEAAGVDRSLWPSMDGSTLSGAMRTGRTAEPREAYADSVNILSYGRPDDRKKRDDNSDKLYCLMTDRYKLIYHQLFPDQTQFFDIQEDPSESKNLANRGLPEMQEMMGRLDALDAYSNFKLGDELTDPERAERLEQLGYGE